MTTPYLTPDIWRDEGYAIALPDGRCMAYADPLSELAKTGRGSGEPWTCGYGCTGPDVHQGTVWTPDEAKQRSRLKIAGAMAELDRALPWWRTLNNPREDVLVNMAYQMGLHRLLGFKKALAAMLAGDFEEAAREMLDSAWARQTPRRARRLAEQMRTGNRAWA